jgi:hypothetical protein
MTVSPVVNVSSLVSGGAEVSRICPALDSDTPWPGY